MLFQEYEVPVLGAAAGASATTAATNCIINADCLEALRALPPAYVDCVITSPPYYGQRDYSQLGQIGREASSQEYIDQITSVFTEVLRVIKPTGTLWLNVGDKYLKGELLGLPWRIALALKDAGWKLRSDVIWHKPNAMPSSVKNRPTVDHEYLFMFAASETYYYNGDAIREPHKTFSPESRMRGGRGHFGLRNGTPEVGKNGGNQNLHTGRWDQAFHPQGRSKRTVWSVPLSKFRDAHFAVFPERLIEPCVLAGSKKGNVILDPFFGAGTTGVVSARLGRRFVGIEINKEYCSMAQKRLVGS